MSDTTTRSATRSNRVFITEMLGQKRRLEDYPDRVDPNLIMHEPLLLPFGGTYVGLADFQRFYGKVREYYDFETWQLIDVVADGDIVFRLPKFERPVAIRRCISQSVSGSPVRHWWRFVFSSAMLPVHNDLVLSGRGWWMDSVTWSLQLRGWMGVK